MAARFICDLSSLRPTWILSCHTEVKVVLLGASATSTLRSEGCHNTAVHVCVFVCVCVCVCVRERAVR